MSSVDVPIDQVRKRDERRAALFAEYSEVGNNFRTLTDIRFKLLGLLPLATAAAVVTAMVKGELTAAAMLALSLFGLCATVGLVLYNARNDQLYNELIGRAGFIERELGLPDGYFAHRPRAWLDFKLGDLRVAVSHDHAVTAIYAVSVALWLSLLFAVLLELLRRPLVPDASFAGPAHALAVLLAIGLTSYGVRKITKDVEGKSRRLRTGVAKAYTYARDALEKKEKSVAELLTDDRFVFLCVKVVHDEEPEREGRPAGDEKSEKKAGSKQWCELKARARYHAEHGDAGNLPLESHQQQAARLIALLTDLPPRWIFDCGEDRRGAMAEAEAERLDPKWRFAQVFPPIAAAAITGAALGYLLYQAAAPVVQQAPAPAPSDAAPVLRGAWTYPGTTETATSSAIEWAGWEVLFSPGFVLAVLMLCAGFYLLRAPGDLRKAVGGALLLSLGGLLSSASLIKEFKVESLLTVKEPTVKIGGAQAAGALEYLGSVRGFRLGSAEEFEQGGEAGAMYHKMARRWIENPERRKNATLLFVGSTDEVPLSRTSLSRYEGNVGLARARADTVKRAFNAAVKKETSIEPNEARTLMLVSGPPQPRDSVTGARQMDAAGERRVDVWVFW